MVPHAVILYNPLVELPREVAQLLESVIRQVVAQLRIAFGVLFKEESPGLLSEIKNCLAVGVDFDYWKGAAGNGAQMGAVSAYVQHSKLKTKKPDGGSGKSLCDFAVLHFSRFKAHGQENDGITWLGRLQPAAGFKDGFERGLALILSIGWRR